MSESGKKKDVVIIGGGPAGLSAGIYTARARISTVVVEKMAPGGNMLITERIENYPGFPEGITGPELSDRMKNQYEKFGGDVVFGEVTGISLAETQKTVTLDGQQVIASPVVIVASGGVRRQLDIPGESALAGKGVSYCAVCDGAFFREKTVAVVGGGFAALEEALFLTRYVSRCYLVHRRNDFRASTYLKEEVSENEKITPVLSAIPLRIEGEDRVTGLTVRKVSSKKERTIAVDGVFVSIGQKPNTEFLAGKLDMTETGYVITDETMETSCAGVFACGDVRKKGLYQVATACGDGATAGYFAERLVTGKQDYGKVPQE